MPLTQHRTDLMRNRPKGDAVSVYNGKTCEEGQNLTQEGEFLKSNRNVLPVGSFWFYDAYHRSK